LGVGCENIKSLTFRKDPDRSNDVPDIEEEMNARHAAHGVDQQESGISDEGREKAKHQVNHQDDGGHQPEHGKARALMIWKTQKSR
jgi:hypothetical protein